MAALAKLFKKKHNKENNEPFLKLQDEVDSAVRSNSANSSIYTGDYPTLPRRSVAADPNNPRWKSPYDVVTAPQTRKPTRSCPGAPIHTKSSSSSTYGGASRSRHFSPDYGRRSQHNNKYPTIFEVSGSYENYPNETVDTYDSRNGTLPVDSRSKSSKRSTQQILAAQNSDAYVVGSLRDRPTFQRNQHKRQSLNLRHAYGNSDSGQASYRKIRQRQYNAASTSEYGSADPSPTNPGSGTITAGSKRPDYYDAQSFDNTDYEDSDSEDEGPLSIMDICEQQLRRLTVERNKYKEKARSNKLKYIETCAKVEELMVELAREKREVESLKANLNRTNAEMEHFRSFINQQFRKVGGHYRQQAQQQIQQQQQQQYWLQDQQFLQPPNFSIAHREQAPHLNGSMNSKSQQMPPLNGNNFNCPLTSNSNGWKNMSVDDNPHALGAGEALCSRTEFFGSVNPAFTADLPTSSAPTVNSDHIQFPMLEDNDNEIKIFRRPEPEDDKNSLSASAIEEARDSSAIKMPSFQCPSNQRFSPLSFSRVQDGDHVKLMNDEEDPSINVKSDDLLAENDNCSQKHELAESTVGEDTDQSSDDSLDINDAEKYVNIRQAAPAEPARHADLLAMRRSFSETDLDKLCVQENDDNDNSFVINLDDAIEVNNNETDAVDERRKCVGFDESVNEPRRISRSRYCRYSPKRNADHSSSYSSDDDAIRIFARQLRKRGDLVHFRPGRKNLVNMEQKLFRCFGSGEREAIAQFDYLKDIQTDVSDLASSPTYNS